jgi:hypothetical protein
MYSVRAYHFLEQCVMSMNSWNYNFQQHTQSLLVKGKEFVSLIRHWNWLTLQCIVCSESHFAVMDQEPSCSSTGIPLMMKALMFWLLL